MRLLNTVGFDCSCEHPAARCGTFEDISIGYQSGEEQSGLPSGAVAFEAELEAEESGQHHPGRPELQVGRFTFQSQRHLRSQ